MHLTSCPEKCIALNIYTERQLSLNINNHVCISGIMGREKKQQIKPKESRRKEIMKSRTKK